MWSKHTRQTGKGAALALLLFTPMLLASELKTTEAILASLQPLVLEQRLDGIAQSIDLQIPFVINSAVIQPDALPQLQALAAALGSEQLAGCDIYLIGHTDSSGNTGANLTLSQARAYAVQQWLAQQPGIDSAQLSSTGLGAKQLLPGLPATAASHRRVEVRLADAPACQMQQGLRKKADGELDIIW